MATQPKSRARKRQHEVKAPQHLLNLEEIDRLRAWATGVTDRRGPALVTALLGTGGRRFEVAALRCEDIRIGPGGPEVFFPEVKGGGSATVPISEETYRALNAWILRPKDPGDSNDHGPLIPTEQGEHMHPATLWRAFKVALAEAGIRRAVGVHATRHAAGFLLLRATGDLTKVQTFLRHSSLATTASWYAHVHLPDLRAGLAKAGL